jgi:excisionase family DNA binding protein
MAIEPAEDRLLTVNEVAERLRLHPITVRRHIKAGRLRAVRVGRAVRVSEAELRRFSGGDAQYAPGPGESHQREIGERKPAYRARTTPLPLSTTELVREGRRELELRGPRWRKPFDDMRALRDQMKPLGISTAELVRQARSARDWMYGDDTP